MKYYTRLLLVTLSLFISPTLMAEIVYVHNDILGSPIMETNEQGTVISRSHYKPFGGTLEAAKDDVGYTGHLNDVDLGLTYMQARYYDPVIGRFYSNDPIGYRDIHSFNRYAYANNNPYKYTDPTGMSADCASCFFVTGAPNVWSKSKNKKNGAESLAPATWTQIPENDEEQPSDGTILCDSNCIFYSLELSLQIDLMKVRMNYRQTQGTLIASAPIATFAVFESAGIGFIFAKENAAVALIVTQLSSGVAGDLHTLTAFAYRKKIPDLMESLLKSGRWGKPVTEALKKKQIITP